MAAMAARFEEQMQNQNKPKPEGVGSKAAMFEQKEQQQSKRLSVEESVFAGKLNNLFGPPKGAGAVSNKAAAFEQ